MRFAFFGSSNFSCTVLDVLLASQHELVAVVTQPDQPAGRRMKLCPTVVCTKMEQPGLPLLKPAKLVNNTAFRSELQELKPAALITASYGKIIPSKVLGLTEWPLNVHPSLLPKLRGASPIRSAMLLEHSSTGCCLMRMTPQLDAGDLLLREELAIQPEWNHQQLEAQLGLLGGQQAAAALDAVEAGTASFTPQDDSQATFCGTLTRADTVVDWNRPATELARFVLTWDPDVGSKTFLPDGRSLKLWQASADEPPAVEPGGMIGAAPGTLIYKTKRQFWVATGRGSLRIDELQVANKNRMATASFLAGNSLNLGEILGHKGS